MRELHVLNLGAGIQSTFLYLAWETLGLPKLDCAIFADTQEEPQAVYAHLEWLKSLGRAPILTGTAGSLGDDLRYGRNTTGGLFAAIPAFTTADGGKTVGMTKRQCSFEYKIQVIGRVLRREVLGLAPGRSPRGVRVHQYIGISMDEAGRARRLSKQPKPKYITRNFPLVERWITRTDCMTWLLDKVPHRVPRSACVFCPYHTDAEWLSIRATPEDWRRAVEVDGWLRTTGAVANRDMRQQMYVHRSCQPLTQININPEPSAMERQFNLNFNSECLGVCGV